MFATRFGSLTSLYPSLPLCLTPVRILQSCNVQLGLSFRVQALSLAIAGIVFSGLPSRAIQPRIVEVPNGPAFVRLPGMSEVDAISGQVLSTDALLRTTKPGRMQVMLGTGRQFRMGGDAQLRLGNSGVELIKGAIIGWINPGTQNRAPFTIKTRLATASIQGTTVFIQYTDNQFKIFSWEGKVTVTTSSGQRFTLNSGQQLLLDSEFVGSITDLSLDAARNAIWAPPVVIPEADIERRLQKSRLINGFSSPLDTLPVIERELGVMAPSP
ncbi:putative FecR family protein [Synechococcus sp. NOUM97013]|nr:putative FecR family protein [Synechococcus sp. NOUM97013]